MREREQATQVTTMSSVALFESISGEEGATAIVDDRNERSN